MLPKHTFNNVMQIYNMRKSRNDTTVDSWYEHYPKENISTPDIIASYFEHSKYDMNDILKCIIIDYKKIDTESDIKIELIVSYDEIIKSLLNPYISIKDWYYNYFCLFNICNIIHSKIAPMLGIYTKPCVIKSHLIIVPKTNIKFIQTVEQSLLDVLITIEEMHEYIYVFANKVSKNGLKHCGV
jgi:hypothetical protein